MPLRTAIVEIVVSSLIMPLFDRISEPDYINSLIVGFVSVKAIFCNVLASYKTKINDYD